MNHIKGQIRQELLFLKTPKEFASKINELGLNYIDSGDLDSDELVWEVAREIWAGNPDQFEQDVHTELEKLFS